jgi:uncharacterized glyoxalase superfamily protein PhnB
VKRLTPVLIVDAVEPSLAFWVDRLGFTKSVEVPHGKSLGFVILVSGDVELMLQSRASVEDDLPFAAKLAFRSDLYLEVESLDQAMRCASGAKQAFPERTTFYGAREAGYFDPAGNLVIFSQQAATA